MKKKILLLSDDLRFPTGVGVMSKELIFGTVHKYDWIQLGGGKYHPEAGNLIDVSEDVKRITGINDADVKILPYNGYGDIHIIRKIIQEQKPDALLHFTDPHYFKWLYDNEHEIRQTLLILYYHAWDNIPDPIYNKEIYESCDWVGCISKLTYGVVNRVANDVTQIDYVPHGINSFIYKPIEKISDEIYNSVKGEKEYDFILFYNNRNMRRKQTSDLIYSFKLFCDELSKEEADRCLLLMHTRPVDDEGTDLISVKKDLCPDYNVRITTNSQLRQVDLNELYNLVDCTINIAHTEGFGLSTAESLMAGTPIIVNVTGGLQDQCGFNFTADDYVKIKSLHNIKGFEHGEWCVPVWPSAINITGSVSTPYIYEDRVSDEDVADAIMKMYKMTREERKSIGLKGREWAQKNLSANIMCQKMIQGIESTLNNFKPRKKFELHKII